MLARACIIRFCMFEALLLTEKGTTGTHLLEEH